MKVFSLMKLVMMVSEKTDITLTDFYSKMKDYNSAYEMNDSAALYTGINKPNESTQPANIIVKSTDSNIKILVSHVRAYKWDEALSSAALIPIYSGIAPEIQRPRGYHTSHLRMSYHQESLSQLIVTSLMLLLNVEDNCNISSLHESKDLRDKAAAIFKEAEIQVEYPDDVFNFVYEGRFTDSNRKGEFSHINGLKTSIIVERLQTAYKNMDEGYNAVDIAFIPYLKPAIAEMSFDNLNIILPLLEEFPAQLNNTSRYYTPLNYCNYVAERIGELTTQARERISTLIRTTERNVPYRQWFKSSEIRNATIDGDARTNVIIPTYCRDSKREAENR